MSNIAIRCDGLFKQYRRGQQERYRALRDILTDSFSTPFRRLRSKFRDSPNGSSNNPSPTNNAFWALQDISFEVKPGETVGIIGRNGAGKSTLLKILSRITRPTKGSAEIHGRVGSLLEVGTGFHPELTGRENIYLNSAILGMRRSEVERKFDEIVAFAEVEKFIDTPVKRYSTGMYVRLAFAVAAHMETENLLVDEVLAVGDMQFQNKCLGKMSDIGKHGRTVFFVSHNMAAVRKLCTKGIVLSSGRMEMESPVDEAIKFYLQGAGEKDEKTLNLNYTQEKPQFKTLKLLSDSFNYGEYLLVETEIVSPYSTDVGVEVEIHDEKGMPLVYTSTAPMGVTLLNVKAGVVNRFVLKVGPLNLATGDYSTYFWLVKPWAEFYHAPREPLVFNIKISDPCGSGFDFRQSYARGATTLPIQVSNTHSF